MKFLEELASGLVTTFVGIVAFLWGISRLLGKLLVDWVRNEVPGWRYVEERLGWKPPPDDD